MDGDAELDLASNVNSSLSIVNIAVESATHAKPTLVTTADPAGLVKPSQQEGAAAGDNPKLPTVSKL